MIMMAPDMPMIITTTILLLLLIFAGHIGVAMAAVLLLMPTGD